MPDDCKSSYRDYPFGYRFARLLARRHSSEHSRAAGSGLMYSPPHTLQYRVALGAFAVGSLIFTAAALSFSSVPGERLSLCRRVRSPISSLAL